MVESLLHTKFGSCFQPCLTNHVTLFLFNLRKSSQSEWKSDRALSCRHIAFSYAGHRLPHEVPRSQVGRSLQVQAKAKLSFNNHILSLKIYSLPLNKHFS